MSIISEAQDILNKKKKKDEEIAPTRTTKSSSGGGSIIDDALQLVPQHEEEDIAPYFTRIIGERSDLLGTSLVSGTTKKKEDERTWFQSGVFEDGYQFGDVSRTILATGSDLAQDLVAGATGIVEGTIDAGAYLVGGVANLLGADKFAESTRNFIKKDIIDEEKIGAVATAASPVGVVRAILNGGFDWDGSTLEEESVFGEKSDSLVQSGGQLLGQIGLQFAGVPWFVTSGVTSFGGEVENAFKQDASYGEAGLSGVVNAGAEILSEKLFGGSGLGEKGIIPVDLLTKGIANKATKALFDYGIDVVGEGIEEGVSQFFSNLGTALYREENLKDILFSEEAVDSYIESFIGGMVLGGVMNASHANQSRKTKTDYHTGLTANDQKVFDKVFNDRLAEATKEGKKPNKAKIREELLEDINKGYISTEEIESVLGGDSYKAYKDTVDSENALLEQQKALQDEYNALNKMAWRDMTGEQFDRRDELKTQLAEIKAKVGDMQKNSQRSQLKSKLGSEVFSMVKKGRLVESYNEHIRSTQDLDIDVTQYDGVARKTIENAIKSGANNSNRVRDFVELSAKAAKAVNTAVDFGDNKKVNAVLENQLTEQINELSQTPVESRTSAQVKELAELQEMLQKVKDGKITVNGVKTKDGILINTQSAKALDFILGHEVTHKLEKTEAYKELQKSLFDYAESLNDLQGRRSIAERLYKNIKGTTADQELTSDLAGEYLFSDSDFIRNFAVEHRNAFQKVLDQIKYWVKIATAGSKEARQLEKAKKLYEDALRELAETEAFSDSETQFSIREEAPPKKTIKGYKVFKVVDGKLYPPMVDNPSGNGTPVGVWLNADIGGLAHNKDGSVKLNTKGRFAVESSQGGSLAFRPGWHLGEYPDASQFGRMDTSHPLTDEELATYEGKTYKDKNGNVYPMNLFPYNFVWAECEVAADHDYQLDAMSLGVNEKGSFVRTQAGLPYVPTDGYYKYRTNADPNTAPWIITGAIKVNRILDDADVAEICAQHGVTPQTREGYTNLKIKDGGSRTPGNAIDLANFGLLRGDVVPTDANALAEISMADGIAKERSATAMSLLKTLPGYAKRKINFSDKKVIQEFGMNNQDVEYYRELAKSTNDGYLADDNLYSGDGVQYSLSAEQQKADADYFKAIESGDTETAQKMVDEAAQNAGYTVKAYHGTRSEFTVFDKHKSGDNYNGWSALGDGLYFAKTVKGAEHWAGMANGSGEMRVMPSYLRLQNPLVIDPNVGLPEDVQSAWDEAGEDASAAEVAQALGYDGIIKKGFSDDDFTDTYIFQYVVFDANQIKSAEAITRDNSGKVIPLSQRFNTENNDIRFSLTEAVEETKDLFAVHNLQSSELAKTLELGGLPMPSIAVIKASQGHEAYGDVSLIFPKDTIDPKASSANKVYGGDAWTPTYPRTEYKPNKNVQKRIKDKYYELAEKFGYDDLRPLYRYVSELESELNGYDGEAGLLDALYSDDRMMQVYLQDSGKGKVEPVIKETRTEATEAEKEMNQWFIDRMGEDVIRAFKAPAGVSPFTHRTKFMEQYGELAEQAYRDLLVEKFDFSREDVEGVLDQTERKDILKFIRNAEVYLRNGGVTVKTETDYEATKKAIVEKSADGYKEWVDNLFKGIEEKSGIRNNLDAFTSSGNRRSWDALHWENTLENVVKAMKGQDETGVGSFSPYNSFASLAQKRYGSIAEIKADSDRLGKVSEEEYEAMGDSFANRLAQIADSIKNPNERNPFIATDEAAELIVDTVRSQKTKSGMLRYMQKWNNRVTESTVDDIVSLVNDIANMPTGYFEAKPKRAVRLDEVGVFVIPNNADVKLKQELLNRGYSIAEYDPNVEGDRQRVVNQFEEYKFSLSDASEPNTQSGGHHLYGKDFGVKSTDDIAPYLVENEVTAPADTKVTDEHPSVANNRADVESVIGDKDSFVSKQAMELYNELANLKKGVRASKKLGYLLDHGHEWRSIKTALLNIKDNPNQVVNPNSAAESVAREMLGREYDAMVEDFTNAQGVTGKIFTKMQNLGKELENNKRLRDQSNKDFDGEIARLQAEYDVKKNKNTKVANDLLRRIERTQRMKANVDADYGKRISDLENRIEKMSKPEYKTAMQRKAKQNEYSNLMANLVGDTATWVDKKLGLSYKVNTLRRNLRDVVRDANGNKDIAKADAIYDELQGKYNHNEAELKRESMRIKGVFQKLNLNHAEDTYAHMLGEFRHNPDSKLTEADVKEFYEKHKSKIDTNKIDTAIEESRKVFDDLIVRVNERLREQGMKEIPYRQGYFPHFTNPKQGWLAKLLNWKTVDTEIPTSIAGLTETFNPERSWQGFSKQRKGDTTDYSLEQGLDTYIHGALDWIYHIEDIQKRRALENHIRYVHSEEGVKAKVDKIRNSEELDADEAQRQIDAVYAEANNPLNNFVTNLRAGTNTLANKKSENDRQIESDTNRKIYSVMTNLNNRINANMVVGSFSSALTNFIPITQSWMEVSPVYSLKGMRDTIISTIRDDGMVNKSDFLTNRLMNEENLYQTTWDKVSDKAGLLMEAIDSFTSQTVWRSKYLQNISEGMSETEAIKNADQFAENVIAGRSRGNQPTIFDAKNPITKIFTAFQLEVANQYGYMFKDAPQDSVNKARLVKGYATAFLGAYAYNALYSSLVGRDAAFDPISILEDLFKDLFGDDDEREEPGDAFLNLVDNVLEEVPFVGGLLGGGRIPISSVMPYSGEYEGLSGFVSDISEGDWEKVAKEMLSPLYYLAMPVGGGQIKKTVEGLGMFSDDHPVAGSYTDSGSLRFPVEDTFWNRTQAALFGQYANKNARDYFDNERSPLKEKQIQEYIDVDLPIRDYWEYREGLSEQETLEDKFDYIAGLDLPVAKKNILINNIVDRKEPVDMEGYEDFSGYEEFDFATKYPEKYEFFEANNISFEEYQNADEDGKRFYSDAYEAAKKSPAKVTMAKAVSDSFVEFYRLTKTANSIKGVDLNGDGKTDSGSKKANVKDYIFSLDLDYGQKIILYRSMYDSKSDKATYNLDIVNYLDSRSDISYEEMVAILEELDFKVDGNYVSWD